jgi:hypothetical protein
MNISTASKSWDEGSVNRRTLADKAVVEWNDDRLLVLAAAASSLGTAGVKACTDEAANAAKAVLAKRANLIVDPLSERAQYR